MTDLKINLKEFERNIKQEFHTHKTRVLLKLSLTPVGFLPRCLSIRGLASLVPRSSILLFHCIFSVCSMFYFLAPLGVSNASLVRTAVAAAEAPSSL